MFARPTALAVATLAAVACGPSKEAERVEQLHQICLAAVGKTIIDVEMEYGLSIRIAACSNDTDQVSTLQCVAPGESLCILGFDLPGSTDQNVCEPTGCYFACEIRAVESDMKLHEEDHEALVCGSRWVKGQPTRPFFNAPVWIPGMLP
jgi:hypothetical protein